MSSQAPTASSQSGPEDQEEQANTLDPEKVFEAFAEAVPTEIRLMTFGHVIGNQPPVNIGHENSHVPPSWARDDSTMERLWWQNSRFDYPVTHRAGLSEFRQTLLQRPGNPHPITVYLDMEWNADVGGEGGHFRLSTEQFRDACIMLYELQGRRELLEVPAVRIRRFDRISCTYIERPLPDILRKPIEKFLGSALDLLGAYIRGEVDFEDMHRGFHWYDEEIRGPQDHRFIVLQRMEEVVDIVVNDGKLWKAKNGDQARVSECIQQCLTETIEGHSEGRDMEDEIEADARWTEARLPLLTKS